MKFLSRVAWSEGMYLGPHHFQAQSRYFEDSVQFATSTCWFQGWGIIGHALDEQAIANGTVALLHARGIFPDGLPFEMPHSDSLPAPRTITDLFLPTYEELVIHLAIPDRKPEGLNCSLNNGSVEARYVAAERVLHDENTGRDEKSVRLGRKNIRLLAESELTPGLVSMPIARVRRDGSGHLHYDPTFVPPCTTIAASEHLLMMVRRLVEVMEEKSATLASSKASKGKFEAGMSAMDVANFWFLHTINASLAPLRHFFFSKRGHPEELFREMSRLGGSLCTFAVESHPRTLPVYDHLHLDRCFQELDDHIRRHLEIVVPSNTVTIPLKAVAPNFYAGDVIDSRCLRKSRWILGLNSPIGEAQVILKTPQAIKLCSSKYVGELVKRALPGLTLTHMQVPPSAISAKVDLQYFSMTQAGPCWDHIVQTRSVGIYVPAELPKPELELQVILDS